MGQRRILFVGISGNDGGGSQRSRHEDHNNTDFRSGGQGQGPQQPDWEKKHRHIRCGVKRSEH